MGKFEVQFRTSVEKELKRIPQKDQIRILQSIALLSADPHPPSSKKLSGQDRYRLRQGDYRILYEIFDQELVVVVVRIGHRRDVYR